MLKMLKKYRAYMIAAAVLALYALMFSFGITCPIKFATGISCPGCGMTRAVLSLIRFDLYGAFLYHPLVFALPILLGVYIFFSVRKSKKAQEITLILSAILFFTVYTVRFFIGGEIVVFSPHESAIYKLLSEML